MTKKEIARLVYNKTQLSLVDAQDAVQAILESISTLLIEDGRVELRGFGVFSVQHRAARKAFNPRTGEAVNVDEHDTIVFKPRKAVKAKLQNRVDEEEKGKEKPAAKAGKTKKSNK